MAPRRVPSHLIRCGDLMDAGNERARGKGLRILEHGVDESQWLRHLFIAINVLYFVSKTAAD